MISIRVHKARRVAGGVSRLAMACAACVGIYCALCLPVAGQHVPRGGGDPFGGDNGDPFGGDDGDPFGGDNDDPFGGDDGDPFGGDNGDPFGGDDGDPFGGQDPEIDMGLGGGPMHTTVRFGPGMPEVAVEPSQESGAIAFDVVTPVGVIPILVQPAGPDLSLTPPPPVEPRAFRPPSIFSAPLPTGSGARALGFGGTFTAIADDATAASWNPAGLIQLKRPEVSAVYRSTWVRNDHASADPDMSVGSNDYHSQGLNYLTAALPFQVPGLGLNAVFSLNYQEAYDFTSAFSAGFADRGQQRFSRSNSAVFSETQIDRFAFEPGGIRSDVEVTTEVSTRSTSSLSQVIDTELDAALEFRQQGIIDAISPALAVELNPRFAIGAALNVYQDELLQGGGIRSTTRSRFTARSTSRAAVQNRRATTGRYTATEVTTIPGGGPSGPDDVVIESEPTQGQFPEVVQEESVRRTDVRIVEGEIIERNAYDDLQGVNATFGLWWVVSDFLTLGAAVDLPWTAESTQTRSLKTVTKTYDEGRTRLLGATETFETETRDVEFEFPVYGAVGIFLLWNPNLYTAVDIGYAQWSEFAYDIEGQGRINPFDGTPHGQNAVDDTWSVRMGTEYLLEFEERRIEIPLRLGLAWEQRPAIGDPDEYIGFSLGSGIAIGPPRNRWILDVAYGYLQANDVQGLVPEKQALKTDTRQHQVFVSLIKHF